MDIIQNKSKSIINFLYVGLMFSICVVLFVYIFPKEPKFQYNFTKGSPWLHEDLIADFDFPISKSESLLNKEYDSIRAAFIPYFSIDTTVSENVISYFKNEIQHIKEDLLNELAPIPISFYYSNRLNKDLTKIETDIINALSDAYKKGILDSDTIQSGSIFIVKNEIAEKSDLESVYTVELVYDNLKQLLRESSIYKIDSIITDSAFQDLITTNNIIPNLIYNYDLSKTILENRLNAVSINLGMVQSGELIILRGSIVDEETYRILNSLKNIYEAGESNVNIYVIASGISILLISLFIGLFLYLRYYHKNQLFTYKTTAYIVVQILMILISSFIIIQYTDHSIFVVPFTLFALLILTFYSFHIAIFVYLPAILMIGFFVQNGFEFIFIQFIAGLMAMFSMRNIQKRSQIFISLIIVFITYAALHTGFSFMKHGHFTVNSIDYLYFAISSFLLLLFLPFVFIYERVFGFISDFSLMELSDTNHPALRKLAENAPGTFQHTLQVANLTESVVRELGGNSLLARTGALYHDIGKAETPEFFIENQTGGNIHEKYSYEQSAEKIIKHVHAGVKIAKQYKIPQQVADFITMHHGTGMTKYFYNSWINENPGKEADKSKFSYPGPKPQTLETAIMMMADSIEAASRTLKNYTEESISNLVDNIIENQLKENQFSNVDITLKQITHAKQVFINKLKNIYHSRIEYPDAKNEK